MPIYHPPFSDPQAAEASSVAMASQQSQGSNKNLPAVPYPQHAPSKKPSVDTTIPQAAGGSYSSSSAQHSSSAFSPNGSRMQGSPSSPVKIISPERELRSPQSATIEGGEVKSKKSVTRKPLAGGQSVRSPTSNGTPTTPTVNKPQSPQSYTLPIHQQPHIRTNSEPFHQHQPSTTSIRVSPPRLDWPLHSNSSTPDIRLNSMDGSTGSEPIHERLSYHHTIAEEEEKKRRMAARASQATVGTTSSDSPTVSSTGEKSNGSYAQENIRVGFGRLSRPSSSQNLMAGTELHHRGRSLTPQDIRKTHSPSPSSYSNPRSARTSFDGRAQSTADLTNLGYSQQVAHQNLTLDNARLRTAVGSNAALLDTRKTLDMYRANLKKTSDQGVQYEFALFMVNAAQDAAREENAILIDKENNPADLLREARAILQKLANNGYAYAQYYLADGYASGLFSNGKPDNDRSFPLFVSAGKHGHAEAAYRAALCFEFGWGCRKDYAKAVNFHRQAASKGHPGACTRLGKAGLTGDMGLGKGMQQYREGLRWLKRGTENADRQHNAAPYELGLLHVTGYGDDVFKDEKYAAQLFTQASELGHAEASLQMGRAYEHGLLTCPRDPALSVHFYTGAAQGGLPEAMMALCAWYMVGAEPVLPKDEMEAYEWAKQAGDLGYIKAEFAMGYFTEMGIGCRRDPLEANVWYVRAADKGDERSRQRLAIIRAAESGDALSAPYQDKNLKKKKSGVNGKPGDDKDCIVM